MIRELMCGGLVGLMSLNTISINANQFVSYPTNEREIICENLNNVGQRQKTNSPIFRKASLINRDVERELELTFQIDDSLKEYGQPTNNPITQINFVSSSNYFMVQLINKDTQNEKFNAIFFNNIMVTNGNYDIRKFETIMGKIYSFLECENL